MTLLTCPLGYTQGQPCKRHSCNQISGHSTARDTLAIKSPGTAFFTYMTGFGFVLCSFFFYAFTGKQVYFLTINQSTQVRDPFVYVACNIILISILVNTQKQVLFSIHIYIYCIFYLVFTYLCLSEHLQQFRIVTHTEICIQVLPCLV